MADSIFNIILFIDDQIPDDSRYTVFDYRRFEESANNKAFNESKFIGSIALALVTGKVVAVPAAQNWLTKKGELLFLNGVKYRIPGSKRGDYLFTLVINDVEEVKPKSNEDRLVQWVKKNGRIVGKDEFVGLEFNSRPLDDLTKIKITCGLTARFTDLEGAVVTGHMTRCYGVTVQLSKEEQGLCQEYIGKNFKGELMRLIINKSEGEKQVEDTVGGHIVHIPTIPSDKNPTHITVKTDVKSALSGPIIIKYNNGDTRFRIRDIEPTSKQDHLLKVDTVGDVDVQVTGWYCYAVDPN